MSDRVRAPWSPQVVAALNEYQFGGGASHPYTCGEEHAEHVRLVAMPDGWHCPVDTCGYRQDSAHRFAVVEGGQWAGSPGDGM